MYENFQNFLFENFHFLVVKFSVYLDKRVFVMTEKNLNDQKLDNLFIFVLLDFGGNSSKTVIHFFF